MNRESLLSFIVVPRMHPDWTSRAKKHKQSSLRLQLPTCQKSHNHPEDVKLKRCTGQWEKKILSQSGSRKEVWCVDRACKRISLLNGVERSRALKIQRSMTNFPFPTKHCTRHVVHAERPALDSHSLLLIGLPPISSRLGVAYMYSMERRWSTWQDDNELQSHSVEH